MTVAGDFNVNYVKDGTTLWNTVLLKEFQLQNNNNTREYTSRYGTTIDEVFIRYLGHVIFYSFVTHFTYHQLIITNNRFSVASNITITVVNDRTAVNVYIKSRI